MNDSLLFLSFLFIVFFLLIYSPFFSLFFFFLRPDGGVLALGF